VPSHSRTRVKICGLTRVDDARAAAEAGADAIGLNFYAPSPRFVALARALEIVEALPPFVSVVGLFVNPTRSEVEATLAAVPLDLLQFHGDESPEFCASFARPYLKAVRVRPDTDLLAFQQRYATARGHLFDAWHEELYGGSGASFDWKLLNAAREGGSRCVLAGGLNPGNVAAACRSVRPWAVDVSSGVETAPGLKSAKLITQFIEEVNHV
jgi:phosphoribosylanthranilate isomerase